MYLRATNGTATQAATPLALGKLAPAILGARNQGRKT
jgi:hypothetical protein